MFGVLVPLLILASLNTVLAGDYNVVLSSNSPVVRGGTVKFKAQLYEDDQPAKGWYRYDWRDNSLPDHHRRFESNSSIDLWNVTYGDDKYPPGPYVVQVTVDKYIVLMYYPVTSQRLDFTLTDTLNGDLDLIQNNKTLESSFISNAVALNHTVRLKDADLAFLQSSATSIMSYWFIDCKFSGMVNDFSFLKKYNKTDQEHTMEVLIVAGFDPITTPAPSTTVAPTTLKPNTTTLAPNVTTTSTTIHTTPKKKIKRSISKPILPFNGTFPFICGNSSVIPMNPNNTYGYFKKKFIVKAPVSNLTVTGNNWLEHGDLLSLKVKCLGSSMFSYCIHFFSGKYNITGNETCIVPDMSEKCEFPIRRFFIEPKSYTVVIVIYNEVSKLVSPITVTVYKVTKQGQLSVIVVPVAFSFIAVILIVFGVAYYLQNRSRFTVEVADFNFGKTYNDLEYKTFKERLRDSVSNAFTRVPSPSSSEVPVWPPGKRYGSMT